MPIPVPLTALQILAESPDNTGPDFGKASPLGLLANLFGAVHDATFGPTVMAGLGGVFAEALADVVFRLPPLQREDGLEMLSELRGARLLAGFRGEAAACLAEKRPRLTAAGSGWIYLEPRLPAADKKSEAERLKSLVAPE